MFELNLDSHNQDDRVKISIKGEIDIASAPEFKNRLYEMVGEGEKDIELICDGLSYIDSTGLGILVGALKRVRKNQHNVYVLQLRENIRKLFRITGLDQVFILEEAV